MPKSGHGGDLEGIARQYGLDRSSLLDFSASINPLGPPESVRHVLNASIADLVHYPDPQCRRLRERAAQAFDVDAEQLLFGNGSTELLYLIPRALKCARGTVFQPCYSDYARALRVGGASVHEIVLTEPYDRVPDLSDVRTGDLVLLGSPNNPTGVAFRREEVLGLVERRLSAALKSHALDGVTKPLAHRLAEQYNPGTPIKVPLGDIYRFAGRRHLAGASRGAIARELVEAYRSGKFRR